MKLKHKSLKGIITAVIALITVFLCSVLYEQGIITDELYLKLISAANTDITSAELEVHFIDVGQAECILIKAPSKTVLIDCGEIGFEKEIENHLRSNGVYAVDLFIATHPHSDHIGSASELFKRFPVKEVLIPEIPEEFLPTTSLYEDLLNLLDKKNCNVSYAEDGLKFDLGDGAYLEVLGSRNYLGENLNNYSVVSKLCYGEYSFLFTGDSEEEIELMLLNEGVDLSATVFSAGHHGSNTSNGAAFLKAVGAKYAVISCGKNNDYGHPHKEVLKRFKNFNTEYYRTDYDGCVIFAVDEGKLTVKTENGGD